MDIEKDEDCLFFQAMADHGHYGRLGKNESRQGTYVFTSDGKFLSSINDLSADRVLKMLEEGLQKWKALPDSQRAPSEAADISPKHRWEDFYPNDGLVLKATSRDLPVDLNPDSPTKPTWNRDAAWFSKTETSQLIPLDKPVGHEFELPEFFTSRIARFHLVDSVKGQTNPFNLEEIEGSRITGKIDSANDSQVTIRISGNTAGTHKRNSRSRGVKTNLRGTATFDLKREQFANFEIICVGERWGRTQFNDRRRELDSSPIGYVFQMAQPNPQTKLTPGIMWAYDAPWIKQPSD